MSDFIIIREERKQGGGYICFKAHPIIGHTQGLQLGGHHIHDPEITLAQASYWPAHRSAYLWSAKAMEDERCGRKPAFGRQALYKLEESDILALVQQEAQLACNQN